jgi:CheY-like chemotaxis protein
MARILIIDDVPGVRRSIAALLSRNGHEVELVDNGRDGVQLARSNKPDLIFVDMLMPGQDGVETLEQLRGEGLGSKTVAMSGGGSLVGREEALSLGAALADASLVKPFENSEILTLVDRLTTTSVAHI